MKKLFLSLAAVVALTGSAQAVPTLEFDDDLAQTGALAYAGGAAPLIGTGILFDTIRGIDTPDHDGEVLQIHAGVLNFTTGANVMSKPLWIWEAGGSFKLTGTAYVDDGYILGSFDEGDTVVADGTDVDDPLIAGYFASDTGPAAVMIENGSLKGTFSGLGLDTKHAGLISYFGLTGINFEFAQTEITGHVDVVAATRAFTALVDNADITNTQVIPEPATASVALLGLGAVSMGVTRRRA